MAIGDWLGKEYPKSTQVIFAFITKIKSQIPVNIHVML